MSDLATEVTAPAAPAPVRRLPWLDRFLPVWILGSVGLGLGRGDFALMWTGAFALVYAALAARDRLDPTAAATQPE